jgi:hypothetical protein
LVVGLGLIDIGEVLEIRHLELTHFGDGLVADIMGFECVGYVLAGIDLGKGDAETKAAEVGVVDEVVEVFWSNCAAHTFSVFKTSRRWGMPTEPRPRRGQSWREAARAAEDRAVSYVMVNR